MKKTSALLALALGLLVALATPGTASAEVDREMFPIDVTNFNECTNEDVHYTGTFHGVIHRSDGNFVFHFNPLNVTGVGLTSGNTYNFVGGPLNQTINTSGERFIYTEVNNLVLVTRGSETNLLARYVAHLTINPDGEVILEFEGFTVECRA